MPDWHDRVWLLLLVVAALFLGLDTLAASQASSWRKALNSEPDRALTEIADSSFTGFGGVAGRSASWSIATLEDQPLSDRIALLEALGAASIAFAPTAETGFRRLAQAALLAGDTATASIELQRALDRDPTDPELWEAAARVALRDGRFADAAEAAAEAIALDPGPLRVPLLPGDANWARLEGLKRSIDLYPLQRSTRSQQLASELFSRGDLDEALSLLASLEDDGDPTPTLQRCSLLNRLERWSEAEKVASSLIEREDDRAQIGGLGCRAVAEAGQGRIDDARATAASLRGRGGNSVSYLNAMVSILLAADEKHAALETLRQILGQRPDDNVTLSRIASVAESAGFSIEAITALERYCQLNPESVPLRLRLARLLISTGRSDEAADIVLELMLLAPSDPKVRKLAAELSS